MRRGLKCVARLHDLGRKLIPLLAFKDGVVDDGVAEILSQTLEHGDVLKNDCAELDEQLDEALRGDVALGRRLGQVPLESRQYCRDNQSFVQTSLTSFCTGYNLLYSHKMMMIAISWCRWKSRRGV